MWEDWKFHQKFAKIKFFTQLKSTRHRQKLQYQIYASSQTNFSCSSTKSVNLLVVQNTQNLTPSTVELFSSVHKFAANKTHLNNKITQVESNQEQKFQFFSFFSSMLLAYIENFLFLLLQIHLQSIQTTSVTIKTDAQCDKLQNSKA